MESGVRGLAQVRRVAAEIAETEFYGILGGLGVRRLDFDLIARGLPWSTVPAFAGVTGFSQQELADFLGVPTRTFARRRLSGTLGPAESSAF
jgi:hypothetical protein